MNDRTTIAALATAPSPAGIAVVRVSGPQSRVALRAVFHSKKNPLDHPRELIFGELVDFSSGTAIDQALAVFMPGPHSFTGEDIAEFQFHGSPLLVEKLLRSLFAFGAIPAEPGEFTKRAFLNGKLDLVQAEAIADLINASSERALSLASEHLKGRLSSAIEELGEPLREILAQIEASIDFPDEDISPDTLEQIEKEIIKARAQLDTFLQSFGYGQILKEGFRVLLCGRPNVGKSSLLNLLLGRPRAIVSEVSGTTRDLIEEQATIAGYKFVFCDSAGLTNTTDTVEKIGMELARERIAWADLVLLITDATDTQESWKEVLEEIHGRAHTIWMVTNKVDLNPNAFGSIFCDSKYCAQNFYLSVRSRAGFSELTQALIEEVRSRAAVSGESNRIITNERQRSCLLTADTSLERALSCIAQKLPLEMISADIRQALSSLEELVGKTFTEDLLGRIFSKFCIGK